MERNQKMKRKGNLLILGTAFLWSFLGIAIKAVSYHGLTVVGMTGFMAALVLLVCYRKKALGWNRMALLSGVVMAFMNITFFLANKYTTVANAIVLQYSSPIFVVVYYRVFQGKRLKKEQIGAVAVCFFGLLLFFAGQLGSGGMFGNMLALLSGLLFAGCFCLNALPDNNPVAVNMVSSLLCAAVGLGYTIFCVKQPYDARQTAVVLLAGFFCSGMAAVLYAWGIRHTTALNANLIAMSEVLMSPLWAFLIFRESMDPQSLAGAGLMVAAILYETWLEGQGGRACLEGQEGIGPAGQDEAWMEGRNGA